MFARSALVATGLAVRALPATALANDATSMTHPNDRVDCQFHGPHPGTPPQLRPYHAPPGPSRGQHTQHGTMPRWRSAIPIQNPRAPALCLLIHPHTLQYPGNTNKASSSYTTSMQCACCRCASAMGVSTQKQLSLGRPCKPSRSNTAGPCRLYPWFDHTPLTSQHPTLYVQCARETAGPSAPASIRPGSTCAPCRASRATGDALSAV